MCRIMALHGFCVIILPTFGGLGNVLQEVRLAPEALKLKASGAKLSVSLEFVESFWLKPRFRV